VYRDAVEVFRFGHGVLESRLKALEELRISKTSVIKLVVSTPVVLLRDPNAELKILDSLRRWNPAGLGLSILVCSAVL
jgi:hypothetical protein